MSRRVVLLLLAAGACGGSDIPDAVCPVAATLASFDSAGARLTSDATGRRMVFQAALDSAERYDVLSIELYAGSGVFAEPDGIRTGTFDLADQASYDSCAICVLIYADVDPVTRRASQVYMVDRGSVRLDTVAGRLTGSLNDAEFRHVTIDFADPDGTGPEMPAYTTTKASDCRSELADVSFDAAVTN